MYRENYIQTRIKSIKEKEEKKEDIKDSIVNFFFLKKYLNKKTSKIYLLLFFSVLLVFVNLLLVFFLVNIASILITGKFESSQMNIMQFQIDIQKFGIENIESVLFFVISTVTLLFVKFSLDLIIKYKVINLENFIFRDLMHDVTNKISNLSPKILVDKKPGEYSYIYATTISRIANVLNLSLTVISNFFLIVATVIILLNLSFFMTLFLFSIVSIVVFIFFFLRKYSSNLILINEIKTNKAIVSFLEYVELIKLIKLFGKINFFKTNVIDKDDQRRESRLKMQIHNNLLSSGLTFIGLSLFIFSIFLLLSKYKFNIESNSNTFISFTAFSIFFLNSLKNIFSSGIALLRLSINVNIIRNFLDLPSDESQKLKVKKIKKISNIVLNDLNFNYGEKKVLENINLTFDSGKIYGIAGLSGSGKTTLLEILSGFKSNYNGKYLINNISKAEVNDQSFNDRLSFITQELSLFNDTILNNIKFAKSSSIRSMDLKKIIKSSQLSEFIKSKKDLNYMVGEKGSKLSGGQRQRVTIARALIRNPDLLLLDEPTSSLDLNLEKKIFKMLHNLKKNRIIICVSHNLRLFENFDKIILINKGKIEINGSHSYLMKTSKLYKNLHAIQEEI